MTRGAVVWACLLAIPGGGASAQEETSVQEAQSLDALMDRGVELREAGDDVEALAVFQRAHAASGSAHALAQVALAEQALGRWVSAEEHLRRALETTSDAWVSEHRAILERELASIQARLGRLEVLGGEPGAEVWLNGSRRATLPLEEALWVAPGSVELELRFGDRRARHMVIVETGRLSRETVVLPPAPMNEAPAVEAPIASAPSRGAVGAPAPSPARAASSSTDGTGFFIAGVIFSGLAAASLGVGVAFNVVREDNVAEFNSDRCLGPVPREVNCPGELAAANDAAVGLGVGYVAAGLFALGGAVLFALGAGSSETATGELACGPGARGLGARCGVRF